MCSKIPFLLCQRKVDFLENITLVNHGKEMMPNFMRTWGLFIRYVLKQAAIATLVECIATFLKTVASMFIERLNEWEQCRRRSDSIYRVDGYYE